MGVLRNIMRSVTRPVMGSLMRILGVGDPFAKYIGLDGEVIDESDKGYNSNQIDYALSIFATCTNCTIDLSGTNDHRTAASNDDLNTGLAAGNIYTLNDVLGDELHTDLNAANDSATEAITAFADHSATIDGATKVTIGEDITDMLPKGAEEVANGDFANWTGDNPDSWTISGTEDASNYITESAGGGECRIVSAGSLIGIQQDAGFVTNKYFLVSIEITDDSGGRLKWYQGSTANTPNYINGVAVHNLIIRATAHGANLIILRDSGATDVTIDNVSVKELEVLGSDLVTNGDFATDTDWTKGTGWTISGGTANCDGSQVGATGFYQNIGWADTVNLVKFTLLNYSTGSISLSYGGGSFVASSDGTYTVLVDNGTYTFLRFNADADFIGSIDNVSVHKLLVTKEIADSTNYTGDHYVLPVDVNNFAIPVDYVAESIVAQVITGETDSIGAWVASNNALITSVETPVSVGEFALLIENNTTPTSAGGAQILFTVENGPVYRVMAMLRHIGTGGGYAMRVNNVNTGAISSSVTTYFLKTWYITSASTTLNLRMQEASGTNDGGVYVDSLKVQKVTLS